MRNASAAHFDDDFALSEPPRKKAARRSGGKAKKKQSRWAAFRVNPQRLLKRAAVGASVLCAFGIVVNALELQKGRHPAPLFGTSVTIAEDGTHVASPVKVAPKPVPVPSPVQREATVAPAGTDDMSPSAALNAKLSQITKPTPEHKSEPDASSDEIAHLLERGTAARPQPSHMPVPRPQPVARAAVHPAPSEKHDARIVYGVQLALVKLGFVLKPNGVYGPQTKKAIEIFGKERNLSTNGDLSPRMVKVLAAESGLEIGHP